MERLTERHYKAGDGYYMKCSEGCHLFSCEECERFGEEVDRLGQIEDILGDTYGLDRMRELVEADKAGRCVVLPVKPGDKVWYLTGNPSMTNRLCFDRVDSARVVGFYFDKRGMQVRLDYFHGSHGTYGFYEKTVFSTREAAEAALAKETDHE